MDPSALPTPTEVLYADDEIIVIDKPSSMLTHTHSMDRESPTVIEALAPGFGESVYTVHRLDRMTTGAMVLARTRPSAGELSRQFRDREIGKTYLAIVRGHLDASGTIETPIARTTDSAVLQAHTDYTTLSWGRIDEPIGRYEEGWFSLVQLSLLTGRSHQARRHLHRIDHPIVGDNKHGDKTYNRWAADRMGVRHLYLRAIELSFRHPLTGTAMRVRLGIPELWTRFLREVGCDAPDSFRRDPSVCQLDGE
ncbi:MAG TPA: RluA family pseudouridine synthase [Spirochaetia bacterium]|nr:RluA family pseudouridine synthase [Spirochaetia bacterium]